MYRFADFIFFCAFTGKAITDAIWRDEESYTTPYGGFYTIVIFDIFQLAIKFPISTKLREYIILTSCHAISRVTHADAHLGSNSHVHGTTV